MIDFVKRGLACAVLVAGLQLGQMMPLVSSAEAAQAWTCLCKGDKKRFLASTRHCENQMKLPKGQFCTKAQYKSVYGPACAKKGCRLPL